MATARTVLRGYANYAGNNANTVSKAVSGDWVGAAINGVNTIMGLFGNSGDSARKAAREQYNYNLALQQQAQQWNEYMYRNRYQMQVEDLQKAGINKLYGLGSAPSVTSGTNSIGMPDYVGEKNGRMQQFLTGVQLAQEFAAKKADINLKNQQTKTEAQNTNLKILEQIGQNIQNLYAKKELNAFDKRLIAELRKTESEILANIQNAEKASAEAENARTLKNQIKEQTAGIIAQTEATTEANKTIKRINKWHKDHPYLSGFVTGYNELRNPINDTSNVGKTIITRKKGAAKKLSKRKNSARK